MIIPFTEPVIKCNFCGEALSKGAKFMSSGTKVICQKCLRKADKLIKSVDKKE